jgi:hypothetical protein
MRFQWFRWGIKDLYGRGKGGDLGEGRVGWDIEEMGDVESGRDYGVIVCGSFGGNFVNAWRWGFTKTDRN